MFLRFNTRKKDGKVHRYWSVVENRRLRAGHTTQRTVLYLGEIHDAQQAAWRKQLDVLNEATQLTEQICLFPADRQIPPDVLNGLQVKLSELTLQRPRVFGDCWLACRLWDELQLGPFWRQRLPEGKAEVPWFKVLELLTVRQLVAPGSKWHLHRRWFLSSAMDQLLDEDFAVAAKNRLYECLDRLDAHRAGLFTHLQARWKDLFGTTCDLLLYDLTSTYFEGAMEQAPKAQHGYSRDKRSDCRQVVIAVVLSPEGFPLAYEVMPGNTSDKTTLKLFLKKIQTQYGQAHRIWITCRPAGRWTGAFPPKRPCGKCARAIRPFRIWSAPRAPAGINSKTNWTKCPGKNCATPWKSNCWPTATKSMCWPKARAGAPKKGPSAGANSPGSCAPCARCVARGSVRGNATRCCTNWVPRTKKRAERGASSRSPCPRRVSR
jgi:hypothetical protein